jgi:hypothetical protein
MMTRRAAPAALVAVLVVGLAGCGPEEPRKTLAPTAQMSTAAQALGCQLNAIVSAVAFHGETVEVALQAFLDAVDAAYGDVDVVEWMGTDLNPLDSAYSPPRWFLIYRSSTGAGIGVVRIDGFNGNYSAGWARMC